MAMQNKPAQKSTAVGIVTLVLALAAAEVLLGGADLSGLFHTWYLTRAAGLVAYMLLFGSVALGLLQSLGMLKGITVPLTNLDVHEHLSLWALYATLFHAIILVWDKYVPFGLADVLVPFLSDHEPASLSLGILALYIMLIATVSTYLRSRLTPHRWRAIHLATLLGFLFALIHGAAMGTDTGHPAVAYLYRFTGISVGFLSAYRLLKGVRTRYANSAGRG